MKNQHLIFSVIAAFTWAVLFSSCSDDEPTLSTQMGKQNNMGSGTTSGGSAPDFTLMSVSGGDVSLTDFSGKPLVIFFFGSTCPLCIASGPSVESGIHQAYSSEDIAIIGIDTWNGNHTAVNNFSNTTGVSFDLLLNGSQVEDDYEITYDRLVVVDAGGNVVFKGTTRASSDVDDVVSVLNGLL